MSVIQSMTGFGRGVARVDQTEITVEVRAVNGRFAEVSVRGPRALGAYEPSIQTLLKDRLERGKITVSIAMLRPGNASTPARVDRDLARTYGDLLRELREAAGIETPITLHDLLHFEDVLATDDDTSRDEALWGATQRALEEAADQLLAMRRREGEALAADLALRLDLIEAELKVVEARAPQRVHEAHERLRTRLAELLADERVNPDRLETEIALLADRLDITEECVRLRSHIEGFRAALHGADQVGRRLNFLAQELNREINTIASKANDAEMAHRAVLMKEELEKIREQVQNLV